MAVKDSQVATAFFYDRFSVLYPLANLFLKPQKKALYRAVNAVPPGRLLEVGVGVGKHLKHYKGHTIAGIDMSVQMLKQAQKNNPSCKTFHRMPAENLDFPEAHFDYVVLSHVIAVVTDPEKVLSEACRVLRPGGYLFLLNHFTPDNLLGRIDRFLQPLAKRLHFHSVFELRKLKALQAFDLLQEHPIGPGGYFKLLILQKP